ncbi:hypothetical protein GCM10027436_85810 [Actinophytocola sediminis]
MAAVRTVLVVVRSPVALNRLLDILPVFDGDTRVQLVFTVDHGSRFAVGLGARLVAAGARLISWEEAVAGSFDLALAASDNGDLHRLTTRLVLFPHGVGYQRFAAHERGAVSGLRRSTLVRDDRIVPNRIVVSHPSQLDVVRAVEPRLLPRVVVAGDPCFDRIRLSAPRRDRYSPAFDARGRQLVVLCSTWGRHSLFGRQPDLPARVVAELDADHYRTALVLHPNVWSRHGARQVQAWLRPALDAGLVLVPPDDGWRAALIAADLVVSDHGSLTSYAAGAGVSVLLAEDGGPEVVPGSPGDLLRQRLPRLRRDTSLRDQIAFAASQDVAVPDIVETLFAHQGRSLERLRGLLYGTLPLTPPPLPVRLRPVPVPELTAVTPTVYAVRSRVGQPRADLAEVTLHRFPAVTYDEDQPHPRHLAANDAELDPGWTERAAVVWRDGQHPSVALAHAWATGTLDRLPAVRVVVTAIRDRALLVVLRDGRELLAVGTTNAAVVGSAVWCCAVHGVALDRLRRLDITAGTTTTVHLHPR